MPVMAKPSATWFGGRLSDADFTEGPDSGESVDAGEIAEVGRMEVGEDGRASGYEYLIVGGQTDAHGFSAGGKAFADLDLPDDTEMRLVAQPTTRDRFKVLMDWEKQRDLNQDDPKVRLPVEPKTNEDGDSIAVRDGREVELQIRNGSQSITPDLSNIDLSIPAEWGN